MNIILFSLKIYFINSFRHKYYCLPKYTCACLASEQIHCSFTDISFKHYFTMLVNNMVMCIRSEPKKSCLTIFFKF
jgi:hypothetical protein